MTRSLFSRRAGWLAAGALLLVLACAPLFLGSYGKYLLSIWLIFALSATGLNIPMGLASTYSFGHGGFMLIGAYMTALSLSKWGLSVPEAILLAVVAASLIASLVALPSLRLSGLSLGIVTFAFGSLLFNLANTIPYGGGPQGIFLPLATWLNAFDGWALYYLTLGLFALGALWAYSLSSGKFGRALRTLGESVIVAQGFGINVNGLRIRAIVISGAYGGLAGALLALTTGYVGPDSFLPDLSINLFAAVMIGGTGTFVGPFLGALFVVMIPELTQSAQHYAALIYSLIFLALATYFPTGLIGLLRASIGRARAFRQVAAR